MEITSKFLLIILLLTANNAYSKKSDFSRKAEGAAAFTTILPTLIVFTPLLYSRHISEEQTLKPIKEAKPDAIAYIAANGENYHTARLENAFKILREKHPKATDMELAKMIINNYR